MAAATRILVVEDDPLIALDVSGALSGLGYCVVGPAAAGRKAIDLALSEKPDLILMDINLQDDIDGIEAAVQIQSTLSVPIVFLSALADEATLQRAKLTGPYGYLIKPFEAAELRSTIEVALMQFQTSSAVSGEESEIEVNLRSAADAVSLSGALAEKYELLRKIDFFETLIPSKLEELARHVEITTVEGGTFVHTEDSDPEFAFIVLTGRVSITKTSLAGKELVLSLLGASDCYGLLPLLQGFEMAAAARVQLQSKLLTIPRSHFSKVLQTIPELKDLLIAEMGRRLAGSYELAMSLAHSRVEARILATLVALVSTMAQGGVKNPKKDVRIFLTRRELADLTGTTPETAIRITKQLERDGLLDLTRPGIIKILDVEKLRGLV